MTRTTMPYTHDLTQINAQRAVIAHRIIEKTKHGTFKTWHCPIDPINWRLMMQGQMKWNHEALKSFCAHTGLSYEELTAPVEDKEKLEITFRFKAHKSHSATIKRNLHLLTSTSRGLQKAWAIKLKLTPENIHHKLNPKRKRYCSRAECQALIDLVVEKGILQKGALTPEDLFKSEEEFKALLKKQKQAA